MMRYLIAIISLLWAIDNARAEIIFPQDRDRMVSAQCMPEMQQFIFSPDISSKRLSPKYSRPREGTFLKTDPNDLQQPHLLSDCPAANIKIAQTGYRDWLNPSACVGAGQADYAVYVHRKLVAQFSGSCWGVTVQKTGPLLMIVMPLRGIDYLNLTDDQIKERDFAPFEYDPDQGWVQGVKGENV